MSIPPPAFGPTAVQGDDDVEAFAVVRLALVLSREQLRAALAISHAQMAGEPPLEDMSVKDVRREVEGYLGACVLIELDRETDTVTGRLTDAGLIGDLDAAVDRAYTVRPLPPVQDPRYGEGTVTLQTLDRGEVTIPEPAWCTGHEGQLIGPLAEVSHDGREITAVVDSSDVGRVPLLRASITHAPYLEIRPEPYPLAYLEGMEAASFDAAGLRLVAARLAVYAGRLRDVAGQLEDMQREASS